MKLALSILLATSTTACAGWCDPTRDECWSRPEPKPQVRAWVKHSTPPPRVIIKKEVIVKHEPFPDVLHCKPPLTAVGDQALSEDTARTAAEKHWMANVRWRDGEKYMDFKNAKVDRIECSRSSVPVTNGMVGQVLPNEHRCEIIARPCRPGLEK